MSLAVASEIAGRPVRRSRWWRAAAGLALSLPAWVMWKSYRLERAMCFPEPRVTLEPPSVYGLATFRDVELTAGSLDLKGWYAPSTNRAAVLLLHGAGGNRASLAPEARALQQAGFAALLLELPGHGQSQGQIRWGAPEREAIRVALDWLGRQPDVDPHRLGGFGFSLGGYMLAQVSRDETRLSALALAGTPSNLAERLRITHRRYGVLGFLAAELAFRRSGTNPAENTAVDALQQLAPRPLLVITGDRDTLVPRSMADALFHSAGQPKQLEVIPKAGHGDYATVSPGYTPQLVDFFRGALLSRAQETRE